MNIKTTVFFIFILLNSLYSSAQSNTLPNETVIFSFTTANGKLVTLNKEKSNGYIIYRFGTKYKIEFEYPGKLKTSWQSFTYSFLLRGGGAANEGMDLNYVYFTSKGYQYIIYDTYFANGNKQAVGIKVINLANKKITNIKGNSKSRKGTLTDFRDNGLLTIGEDIFY